jgi:hypothetical protein
MWEWPDRLATADAIMRHRASLPCRRCIDNPMMIADAFIVLVAGIVLILAMCPAGGRYRVSEGRAIPPEASSSPTASPEMQRDARKPAPRFSECAAANGTVA